MAYQMEYQGKADGCRTRSTPPSVSTAQHPLPCGMDADPATSPKSLYKGKTYYCMPDHKKQFDAARKSGSTDAKRWKPAPRAQTFSQEIGEGAAGLW
jgi:YHS domain-containing protein